LWQDAARGEGAGAMGAPGGLGAVAAAGGRGAVGLPGGGSSCWAEACDKTNAAVIAAAILKGAMGIDVTGSRSLLIQSRNIRKPRKRKSPLLAEAAGAGGNRKGQNSLNFEAMR